MLRRTANALLQRSGYEIRPRADRPGQAARLHPDLEPAFLERYEQAAPYSMTSVERMYALHAGIRHVAAAGIEGDVVECGVWRGGSSMLAASTLLALGDTERTLWLFDTFEGMSEPGERDVAVSGDRMTDVWDQHRHDHESGLLAYSTIDEVRANMASTGYPPERLRFVPGKVEDTIPGAGPERIALLRLDTDWYESTRHELEHLYPRLAAGGVLIIDDYGHWQGARQAVDEYLATLDAPLLLHRIDYTGRICLKPAPPGR
jgi:O-methyltransferase